MQNQSDHLIIFYITPYLTLSIDSSIIKEPIKIEGISIKYRLNSRQNKSPLYA